jgi:TonB family protein
MNSIRYSPFEDPFGRRLVQALCLHVALMLVFVVRGAWVPSDDIIIQNALRVDLVEMPDKIAPPVPQVAPPTPTVRAPDVPLKKPKPTPTIEPKSTKLAQENAIDKLKAQQAIERLKNEIAEQAEAKAQPKPETFKGNALASGDSLSGLERLDFDRYFPQLEERVKNNWHLPGWLIETKLRAQVLVLIDNQGQVLKRQIVKSSGHPVFDEEVLGAVDRSVPFPQPPARLRNILAFRGVVFNFPD